MVENKDIIFGCIYLFTTSHKKDEYVIVFKAEEGTSKNEINAISLENKYLGLISYGNEKYVYKMNSLTGR